MLQIRLLGDFHLSLGDQTVTGVKTIRLQSLLAYLLLHKDTPQPRQLLAFLFWPDTSEAQARNNLRNLLYFLRRSLPESGDFLLVDTQTIQWNPEATFTLDVDQFIHAAASQGERGDLQKAIQLYSGDLLPGCYDDWILPERENLRQLFIRALERLIQLLEDERNYSLAIQYAQRMVREEPLSEVAHHRLIRLYAANGDRAKAIYTFHSCASVLERELGVEPGLDLRVAYQSLLKEEGVPFIPKMAGRSPLIGRTGEWGILQSAWRNIPPGQVFFVLITGEAGIGKTRLAEEMVDWAERQGIPTAIARCFATEGELSYAPIAAWLHSRSLPALENLWLSEVGRLLPEALVDHPEIPIPSPLTEKWQLLRLFKALSLALLKERNDLMLLIEDLQWCDRDTIEWILYLLQAQADILTRTRLLVIGTLRTEEIGLNHPLESFLVDLRHIKRITEIELGPLSEAETSILARSITGEEIKPFWMGRLYQETEGNPLFVVEMARLLQGKQLEDNQERFSLLPRVQGVIRPRLAELTPNAYKLVETAAVIGRQFTFPVLKQASKCEEDDLVNGLDELWRRRIVREQGRDTYDFSHEKIRELVYLSLSTARRKMLHRRVAKALELAYPNELDALSAQIASQYEQGEMIETAVSWYLRAAGVSQRLYANQTAIDFYQRALALVGKEGRGRGLSIQLSNLVCEINEDLGDILALLRKLDEAEGAYRSALSLVKLDNPILRARLHRKIGRTATDLEQANEIFNVCEELLNTQSDQNGLEWWHEWIELHTDRIENYHRRGHLKEILELISKMHAAVKSKGTPLQRFHYFISIALKDDLNELMEYSDQGLSNLKAAQQAARESGSLTNIALARFHLGTAQIYRDEYEDAERELQEAFTLCLKTGDIFLKARCLCSLSFLFRRRGQVDDVRRYVPLAMEASRTARSPYHIAISKANAAWVARRDGELEEAMQNALQALAEPIFAGEQMAWAALWPLISVFIVKNRLAEAIDYARRLFACKY